ncbi:MAG: hypothetical protein GXP41_12015 [Chloroflexi bacterium]|nr:hypothetical protein [Chloroflexota bacterium]
MQIVTESELRQQIRQPRHGLVLTFPPGTRFSPAAQDFLREWRVAVRFAEEPESSASPQSNTEPPAKRARRQVEALAADFRLVAGRARAIRLTALSDELARVAEYVEKIAQGGVATPPKPATSPSNRPAYAPSTDDPEVLGWLGWLRAEVRQTQTACGVEVALSVRLNNVEQAVEQIEGRFRSGELAWQLTGLSR